jgi:hypothetical protein
MSTALQTIVVDMLESLRGKVYLQTGLEGKNFARSGGLWQALKKSHLAQSGAISRRVRKRIWRRGLGRAVSFVLSLR